jgi:Xaa-Pro aminopeptidase
MQSPLDLAARRVRCARDWDLERGAVIIASGLPVSIAGTDQFHDFHAHPEFSYLTGSAVPGAVLGFDRHEGWALFAPEADLDERIWVGDGVDHPELERRTGLRVLTFAALGPWLERRRGEDLALLGNRDLLHRPRAYGIQNWNALELVVDEPLSERLSEQVAESRRAKDASEIEAMRAAAAFSRAGHLLAMSSRLAGQTERELQIEVEAEFFRAGALRTAYGSIVGTGSNGAVLHFSPTAREMKPGEIVLMDAGAEAGGYASDVTRTFPVGAKFEGPQRDLYELVLQVQEQAIRSAKPGVEYRDLHMAACRQIAAGLADLGILRGSPDELVERDAHALFFPHGLGHMLGLSTHDAGGCLAGRAPSDRFGLKWLRADLPLQPGYVVTIEPGVYFINPLLDDPERREQFADCVDWERVDGLREFGGIRIEDDVLITADVADVLTKDIPKSIADVEALRAEAHA